MTNYRGVDIPLTQMGKVTSDDLFGPNEQVIFDFYESNRDRYHRALDIGANIGVHSIIMARLGWDVRAYEPDPVHFEALFNNTIANGALVRAVRAAVSDQKGTAAFIRVLDNTTGSCLEGAKAVYGPTETFLVPMVDCRSLITWADLVKLDCEGCEAAIICAMPPETWRARDAILEVGSPEAAARIFAHLHPTIPMWSQKIGWGRIKSLADLPAHHSAGSLFIGMSPPFPGGAPI